MLLNLKQWNNVKINVKSTVALSVVIFSVYLAFMYFDSNINSFTPTFSNISMPAILYRTSGMESILFRLIQNPILFCFLAILLLYSILSPVSLLSKSMISLNCLEMLGNFFDLIYPVCVRFYQLISSVIIVYSVYLQINLFRFYGIFSINFFKAKFHAFFIILYILFIKVYILFISIAIASILFNNNGSVDFGYLQVDMLAPFSEFTPDTILSTHSIFNDSRISQDHNLIDNPPSVIASVILDSPSNVTTNVTKSTPSLTYPSQLTSKEIDKIYTSNPYIKLVISRYMLNHDLSQATTYLNNGVNPNPLVFDSIMNKIDNNYSHDLQRFDSLRPITQHSYERLSVFRACFSNPVQNIPHFGKAACSFDVTPAEMSLYLDELYSKENLSSQHPQHDKFVQLIERKQKIMQDYLDNPSNHTEVANYLRPVYRKVEIALITQNYAEAKKGLNVIEEQDWGLIESKVNPEFNNRYHRIVNKLDSLSSQDE